MTKEEFEKMTDYVLTDDEFEMVRDIYNLSAPDAQENFIASFHGWDKWELLTASAQVLENYRRKNTKLRNETNALKKLLVDIAIWLRKNEVRKALVCIKNVLGRKMFILELWKNKAPLTKSDIWDLIDIVEKSDCE